MSTDAGSLRGDKQLPTKLELPVYNKVPSGIEDAMTTTQLTQQLTHLSDSLKATNTLITRLSKLPLQPGAEPLDLTTTSTVRQELAQDIHESLRQLEEDFELLSQELEDLTPSSVTTSTTSVLPRRRPSARDRDADRLAAHAARLSEDLKHARAGFRRAQLTAKRASEAAQQRERELLFQTLQAPPASTSTANATDTAPAPASDFFANRRHPRPAQASQTALEAQATTDVTAALRRTHALLTTELTRSRFAQETFDQSTAALRDLGEHYTDLSTLLATSRNLLGTLLRSQKSDTWYLETAFYLLLVTLGWLVLRRVVWGPVIQLPWFLWRVFVFLVRWIFLKPLWLFVTATGIVTTEPILSSTATSRRSNAVTTSSTTRPPLIIKPSATDAARPMARPQDRSGPGIPAGAGGGGAKVGKGEGLAGGVSEGIAGLHERSTAEARGEGSGKEPVKRGDGTVLQERGNVPKNPRKKGFEADVEDARQDEKQQQQQREKDEL
ncbi:hypothetical protein B0A50_08684 [Salinomyces thailandicus]|uniref:Sec20 C-terminal domain-containing protein n=1 Tax=Salinomyces thailandicus TaxID=706561 RepID=A0A4V5N5F2_9PEZI|nr:hypothetical protein B0A50_08684 [Salinomyces thailandica]